MVKLQTTVEYFGLTKEELASESHTKGYTKEENLIFDSGTVAHIYDSEQGYESKREDINKMFNESKFDQKTVLKTTDHRVFVLYK